jgi:hypothetical protein
MATMKVPYLVERRGAKGRTRFYWQPDDGLRAAGWKLRRLAADVFDCEEARAIAMREAEAINAEIQAWRAERAQVAPARAAAGSVNDLIARYKASRFYLSKRASTRRGYDKNLAVISRWAGDYPVRAITSPVVQRFYEALLERAPGRANHIVGMARILLEFAPAPRRRCRERCIPARAHRPA